MRNIVQPVFLLFFLFSGLTFASLEDQFGQQEDGSSSPVSGHRLDPNVLDDYGRTALHHAMMKDDWGLEVAEYLISTGADPNVMDKDSRTPLHLAVQGGFEKSVEMLLNYNVDLNAFSYDGLCPLHTAVIRGNYRITQLLLQHQCDIDAKTKRQKNTALHLAAEEGKDTIVQLLLEHGATLNLQNKSGYTPFTLALRKKNKEVVNIIINYNKALEAQSGIKGSE